MRLSNFVHNRHTESSPHEPRTSVPCIDSRMSTIVRENPFVHFEYDHERRLLIGTVKPILPTDEEWIFAKTTIRSFYDSALKTNTVFGMVLDFRELQMLPLSRYDDWATFFNNMKPDTAKCVHKTAIVSDSMFIRTALNAFFTLYTAVRPTTFVSTPEEAATFARSEMCAAQ